VDGKQLYTAGRVLGIVSRNDKRPTEFFKTDTGYYGRRDDTNGEIPKGALLVGLFGINAPFILLEKSSDPVTYSILTYATLEPGSKHRWGHAFIENADPGTHWTSFLDQKPVQLERFTLV
jgi:hypothetical protein